MDFHVAVVCYPLELVLRKDWLSKFQKCKMNLEENNNS